MVTEKDWWEKDAAKNHIVSATARSSDDPFVKLPELPDKKHIAGKTILDLGCGYGRTLIPMARFKPKIAYGLDISEEMLKFCSQYAKKYNVKLNLVNTTIQKLPFRNDSIDTIFSSSVLLHLTKEDLPKVLKEIKRVLKKDGHFFFESSFPNSLSINGVSDWFPALIKSKIRGTDIEPGMPKHYSLPELIKLFNGSGLNYKISPIGYQVIPKSINKFRLPFTTLIKYINTKFETFIKNRKIKVFDYVFPKFFDVSGSKS